MKFRADNAWEKVFGESTGVMAAPVGVQPSEGVVHGLGDVKENVVESCESMIE